jgi:WD repeat-containing protein 68
LCTGGDDKKALIWELNKPKEQRKSNVEPLLSYEAAGEINNLQWSVRESDWISVSFGTFMQILRV